MWGWGYAVDAWTLLHTLGWGVAAAAAVAFAGMRPRTAVMWALVAGVGWEVIERTWVEPWAGWAEPWSNRLTDIAVDGLGAWVGARRARRWLDGGPR